MKTRKTLIFALLPVAVICGAGCSDDDGPGDNHNTPSDCGNGTIDVGEQCDGFNLAGQTCSTQGFPSGGTLTCTSDCTFSTTGCIPSQNNCGNGAIDGGEQCDGGNLNGDTCLSLGFAGGGALTCNIDCSLNTGACIEGDDCGNGSIESTEECDGANLDQQTCVSLGYSGGGELYCAGDCTLNTLDCIAGGVCGDNNIDTGEQCDGANLGAYTCELLGYDGGTLSCSGSCQYDDSGCYHASIMSSPSSGSWTPAFTPQISCTCSASDTDCHTLYIGRATGTNGNIATLEFEKTSGGPPSANIHYWVVVGADTNPSCMDLNAFVSRTDGTWNTSTTTLQVNVDVWPNQNAFDLAACGDSKKLFIITGGGGGYENTRLYFQKQAIVFTKQCS